MQAGPGHKIQVTTVLVLGTMPAAMSLSDCWSSITASTRYVLCNKVQYTARPAATQQQDNGHCPSQARQAILQHAVLIAIHVCFNEHQKGHQ